MYDIFISYSSKDQKIVDAILNYLESSKIRCWIAYRDATAGETYASSVVKAIKEASIFLLVFSENSNASKHVLKEIDAACKHEKTIIPFKIDKTELADAMEYYLSSTHWLDAISAPMDNHLKNLVIIIGKYLGQLGIESPQVSIPIIYAEQKSEFRLIAGIEVTESDLREALALDHLVYHIDDNVHFTIDKCIAWHSINPDIYFMLKDTVKNSVIGYVNLVPITQDCYEKILTGEIWDNEIVEDFVLPYDFPGIYYLNFTSIVVHPAYRNSSAVLQFVNSIVNKLIELSNREIYFQAMIADAVTPEGEKLCKLFGMQLATESKHDSKIYSVSLLPPRFKKSSRAIARLFETYESLKIDGIL